MNKTDPWITALRGTHSQGLQHASRMISLPLKGIHRAAWHLSVIPASERQRQEATLVYTEFQFCQGYYTLRPHVKDKTVDYHLQSWALSELWGRALGG